MNNAENLSASKQSEEAIDNIAQENPVEANDKPEQKSDTEEKTQAEKYYDDHKDDHENLYKLKNNVQQNKDQEFVEDPEKSQAENYYDENNEKLENVYQLKDKKSGEKKKTSNMDVEKFKEEDLPTVRKEDEQDESLPHFTINYNLTSEEVDSGMKLFQKRTLFTKNVLYTIAFCIILSIYFFQVYVNSTRSTITYIGMAICAGAIFIIWFNPWNHRKKIAKAMSTIESDFSMNIYEEYIYIIEEEGGFRINFSDKGIYIIDDEDKYIICVGKERIYIVPKRCLDPEQEILITDYFKNLNERFSKKLK